MTWQYAWARYATALVARRFEGRGHDAVAGVVPMDIIHAVGEVIRVSKETVWQAQGAYLLGLPLSGLPFCPSPLLSSSYVCVCVWYVSGTLCECQ
ncbi:hypothetical protein BDN70DRAFT_515594 [Pholiota conissans]|uniref:Uncharacterized protein n=1 Tax=Pholiota conissans TaxID=109636 RepID=A0A9P6CMP1_9AGAR|nr:hypothetical protein BDN70DRAFT_515594 [Pholiota conissans]